MKDKPIDIKTARQDCRDLGRKIIPLESIAIQFEDKNIDLSTFMKLLRDKGLDRCIVWGESKTLIEESMFFSDIRMWCKAKVKELKDTGKSAELRDAVIAFRVVLDMWRAFKEDFKDYSLTHRMMRQSEKTKDIKDYAHPIVIKYSENDYRNMSLKLDKMIKDDEKRLLQSH